MNKRYIGKTFLAVSAAFVLFSSVSCTYHGPPAHAPAHGYRWHDPFYYYYPGVSVYYHLQSGYYFYYSGSVWIKVRVLPRHIHLDGHDRVKIRIKGKRPYLHHDKHQHRYKSRKHFKRQGRHDEDEREHNRRQHDTHGDRVEKREHRRERHEKNGHKKERKDKWRY